MTRSAREVAIDVRHVSKRYGEGHVAVDALSDVSLEVPHGELVVVLGPSGSGKTTLLNLIGALETPTEGTISVDGAHLDSLDERQRTDFRRDHLGFVFQFFNLIPTLTALENVQLIAELKGAGRNAAEEALVAVGLGERMNHFPGALSGGEQQRVAIARALAKGPELVLCDEPTGALDLETGRIVLGVLQEVNRVRNRTVLVVTHNAAIAEMADRVVTMRSGTIAAVRENDSPVGPEAVVW